MRQVVLVTGCSSGIGLAIACLLARDPDKRFIVYATLLRPLDMETVFLEAAAAEGDAILNETLFGIQMDVTDDESVKRGVASVIEKHGRIDVLINNAGVLIVNVTETVTIESAKRMFDVNFFGVLRLTQEVLPLMKKQKSGRIINIGSDQSIFAYPCHGLYAATKQALMAYSQEMAVSGRLHGIWVSLVVVGPVQTQLQVNMAAGGMGGFDVILNNPDVDDVDKAVASRLQSGEDGKNYSGYPIQQPIDVAEVVLGVVTDEKPHFLYQSSEPLRDFVKRHLTDHTGDSFIESEVEKFKQPALPKA